MSNDIEKSPRALAEYTTDSGAEITLTYQNVRELISTDPNVTDKEVMLFAALCKERKLNPFVKEAYLVKYGNNPAQLIVGKDYYAKIANRHPEYDGCECGVTVLVNGQIVRREGSMYSENQEQLIGGWCRVWRKDRKYPTYDEVSFNEYSTGRAMWRPASQGGKPGTQIRKVAYVHAHREAFPEEFNGLYDASEMGGYEEVLDSNEPQVEVQRIPVYETDYETEEMESF